MDRPYATGRRLYFEAGATVGAVAVVALATAETPESRRKAQLEALLLALPGVSTRTLNHLDAYFVSDKMFACISGKSVGLRLPLTTATELQFSRGYRECLA